MGLKFSGNKENRMRLLLNWLLNALGLLIVSWFVPGFFVKGFTAALIAGAEGHPD